MESQLKKLYSIVESVVACRRELALATGQFSQVEDNNVMMFWDLFTNLFTGDSSSGGHRRVPPSLKVPRRPCQSGGEGGGHVAGAGRHRLRPHLGAGQGLPLLGCCCQGEQWMEGFDFMKPVSGGTQRASEGFLNLANCSHNSSQVFVQFSVKSKLL